MKQTINKSLPYLCFLFIACLFCSCREVQFKSPQPSWISKNETSLPKFLQGSYKSGNDTIRITDKRIILSKTDFKSDIVLSDSILLKKDNDTYFLNFMHTNNSGSNNNVEAANQKTWTVYLIKEEKQKILLYSLPANDSLMIKKLKVITKVQEVKDSSGEVNDYLINPTPTEFKQMLKENLFKADTLDALIKIK